MTWNQLWPLLLAAVAGVIFNKKFPILDELLARFFPKINPVAPPAPSPVQQSELSRVLAIAEKAHGIEPPKAPSDVPQSFGATVPFEVNLSAVVKPKS